VPVPSEPGLDPAHLLAQAGWLRSLALRLVRDEARADDLVQETWRRALEQPPRDREALPAWLARVARNTAAEEGRRAARRRARETRAAKPERVPAAADVVARTEIHRRLVDALLGLEEPFRSALLLRYFDGLTPKAIARRLGVPAATVRSRLARGLERLRRRLDESHGGRRRAWVLPLVPWACSGGAEAAGGATAAAGGVMAMIAGKKVGLVAGVLLVLLLTGVFVVPRVLPGRAPEEVEAGTPLDAEAAATDASLVGRAETPPTTTSSVAHEAPPPPGPWDLGGTVRDAEGEAIVGASVEATLSRGGSGESIGEARTDGQGGFRLDLASLGDLPPLLRAAAGLRIHAWADGFAPGPEDSFTVSLAERKDLEGVAPALVLEPGHVFAGRVLDVSGAPVGGVQVYVVPEGERGRIVARTRHDGSWRGRIPEPGRYGFHAEASGFGTGRLAAVDVAGDRDVRLPDLVLRGEGRIAGVIRFPDGTPAAYASVDASAVLPQRFTDEHGTKASRTTADASGRFELRGLKRGRYALRPGDWRASERDPVYETGESAAVLVVEHRRVLAEVRDAAGRPVGGVTVSADWIHADGSRDCAAATLGRDGRYELWVAPEERLLVSADVAGSNYAEAAIDVGERPWDRTVVLTLEEAADATGRIRLRVTGDDGKPVARMVATLKTTLTGSLVRGLYEVEPDGEGLLPPAPVGTWLLELRPGLAKDAMPVELYFPLLERVVVRPDEVTDVELVARRGGRVRLTLRAPQEGAPSPRDVVVAAARPPAGEAEPIRGWVVPNARGWQAGGLRFDVPCIGRTLLTPGAYRLSVEARGFGRLEQDVEIGAGEIVDVTMDLETGASAVTTGDPAAGPAGAAAVDLDAVRLGQLEWTDEPLGRVLAFVARKLGMELEVTERAKPLLEGTHVTGSLDDVSVRSALSLLAASHGLTWNAVGRTLWIGRSDELLPPPR